MGGSDEMRRFANMAGFDGSDSEWQEDFRLLCSERDCAGSGISEAVFSDLLDDRSARGCFCGDVELRRIHDTIRGDRAGKGKYATPLDEAGLRAEATAVPSCTLPL